MNWSMGFKILTVQTTMLCPANLAAAAGRHGLLCTVKPQDGICFTILRDYRSRAYFAFGGIFREIYVMDPESATILSLRSGLNNGLKLTGIMKKLPTIVLR